MRHRTAQVHDFEAVQSVQSVQLDGFGQRGQPVSSLSSLSTHPLGCGQGGQGGQAGSKTEQTPATNRAVWVESVWLPVQTVSESNGREHWAVKAKRTKRQRLAAKLLCPKAELPAVVRLTRLSRGRLDDDNLRGALKAVRDGIADAFGVPDNDPRLRFEYDQAPRGDKLQGSVLVEVRAG